MFWRLECSKSNRSAVGQAVNDALSVHSNILSESIRLLDKRGLSRHNDDSKPSLELLGNFFEVAIPTKAVTERSKREEAAREAGSWTGSSARGNLAEVRSRADG